MNSGGGRRGSELHFQEDAMKLEAITKDHMIKELEDRIFELENENNFLKLNN